MTIPWIVATLHLLALPLGLGSVWQRARALRQLRGSEGLPRVFLADTVWGLSALLWISTGLYRAFGGIEKGTAYYVMQPAFHIKMGLLGIILLLEIWPMVTLIRWRIAAGKGAVPGLGSAPRLAAISVAQAALVVLMVFAATALARGIRP